MERNLSSVIEKGIFRCMVQPVILRNKKIKFLMDTGCGHDLISQKKIEKHNLETLVPPEPISFLTANGVTDTDLVSNFQTESFKEPINAYVLDDTPSVLSIGKRCMNHDYGFVWPPGREPFMIDPEGKRISLFVNDAGYVVTTGQFWSRKYRVWDTKEFANVNLSMDAAVPRKLAQPYQTEVVFFPKEITFPLKAEYERMNETIEGLKDNVDLQGKEIKDFDDHDDSSGGPGGGGGGQRRFG